MAASADPLSYWIMGISRFHYLICSGAGMTSEAGQKVQAVMWMAYALHVNLL